LHIPDCPISINAINNRFHTSGSRVAQTTIEIQQLSTTKWSDNQEEEQIRHRVTILMERDELREKKRSKLDGYLLELGKTITQTQVERARALQKWMVDAGLKSKRREIFGWLVG